MVDKVIDGSRLDQSQTIVTHVTPKRNFVWIVAVRSGNPGLSQVSNKKFIGACVSPEFPPSRVIL